MKITIDIPEEKIEALKAIAESHYHIKGTIQQKIEGFLKEEVSLIAKENSDYYKSSSSYNFELFNG